MPGRYFTESEREFVIGLFQSGRYRSAEAIAALPEVSMKVHTVRRCIAKFRTDGFEGLKTKPKSGRHRVTTPGQDAAIVEAVRQNPQQPASSTARRVVPGLLGCKETIYRR